MPHRYLALFLPWLAAERAIRCGIAPPDAPFVLIEKQRGALRIAALCPEAAKLGLEVGLPLADARGRVPELVSVAYDPEADTSFLDRLTKACLRYTPSVTSDPPHSLLLDITGCAHLHGGEGKMRQALLLQMEKWRLTVRMAIADTPDAACALARFGSKDVYSLPVAALQVSGQVSGQASGQAFGQSHHALRRAGFRIIGDLADLPRGPLAARFGKEIVRSLDRLVGLEDPHITPRRMADPLYVEMRFPEPIARNDDVLEAIEALIEQVGLQLAQRGEGGRAFAVSLHRSDGHIARLSVETGAPTRDPAVVMRLFCERIESLADPLDPGFGYDSIDLLVPRSEVLAEQQEDFDNQSRQHDDIGPLLDRLMVRYGAASVLRLGGDDSHIPERMGDLRPFTCAGNDPACPQVQKGEAPLRPLMLFDPPQRIEVLASIPDGPPRRFRWQGTSYFVTAQEGPERIAPEWWRRRSGHADNPGLSRDYYRVEEESGHRFWLFRHGLYGRETGEPNWYVHGLFA